MREAFAPLVTIAPVASFGEAIRQINDSEYGLQAGVFQFLERRLPRTRISTLAA